MELKFGKLGGPGTVYPDPSFSLKTPPLFSVKLGYQGTMIAHHELDFFLGILIDIISLGLCILASCKKEQA